MRSRIKVKKTKKKLPLKKIKFFLGAIGLDLFVTILIFGCKNLSNVILPPRLPHLNRSPNTIFGDIFQEELCLNW